MAKATLQAAVMGAIGAGETDLDRLAEHLKMMPRFVVNQTVRRAIGRGFVARAEDGGYRLTPLGAARLSDGDFRVGRPAGRRVKPRTPSDSLRQRAWNAIRIKGRFTVDQLVLLAAHGGERDAENQLRRWLKGLSRAGIVAELPARADDGIPASNGRKVWRLMRDIGERAPVVRAGEVYLPDERQTIRIGDGSS